VQIIRPGDEGDAVRDIQHRLTELGQRIDVAELEGLYGPSTAAAVRVFQVARRLPADGVVGPDTWGQLVEAGYRLGDRTLYLRSPAFRGDDVRALQRMLNALGFDAGKEDGIFGRSTDEGVREFQRNLGDRIDGIVGLDTVRSLERMRPAVGGPGLAVVREEEAMRSMGASLEGSTIAIDAAHGSSAEVQQRTLTVALAEGLARALEERGATTVLLRDAGEDPTPSGRARTANAVDAALCVSFDLGAAEEGVTGAACAFWGTATTHSPAGRRLAELIQGRLVDLGLPDGGVRPLAVALLRETRMPAVQVEPVHVGGPTEAHPLADEGARRSVVQAVADGISAFLAGSAR
jgi:N-acetylmuramoyl-L-alanine amidase